MDDCKTSLNVISLKKEDSCTYNIQTPHAYHNKWLYVQYTAKESLAISFFYASVASREVQLYLSAKVLKRRAKYKYYQFPSC